MVLTDADKREIAALFQSFSEFQRPPMRLEDMLMERLISEAAPRLRSGAQAFIDRPRGSPEDRLFAEAIETVIVPSKRKKAMTKFNRAVKEGMKIAKSSTSYGKKGTISNSKKAFSAVTKTVAKARKGGKAPVKGVLRKIFLKAKGIIGKRKPGTYILGKRIKTY